MAEMNIKSYFSGVSIPNRGTIFHILLIISACAGLLLMPDLFASPFEDSTERPRGIVTSVDNARVLQSGFIKTGTQDMRVKITSGSHAGDEVGAWNLLRGNLEMDKFFEAGDDIILALNIDDEGRISSAQASDYFRTHIELGLFLVFAILLTIFAGWTGLRALLSFVFAILLIWKVLIPSYLLGWDPILISLALVCLITIVTLSLVTGLSRVTLVASLGTMSGVLVTCLLAYTLFPMFKLTGAVMPWAETVLYSGFDTLNLNHLFIAAVFIGASGAVIDLAMDISTAMHELVVHNPDIGFKKLIQSGFSVGKAMTSTLVTTLLMAYISSEIGLIMAFMSKGISPISIINTNFLAAEIFRTIVGSLGLILVAPLTALLGGLIYTHNKKTRLTEPISL
jgi:uncharacterized membrane protein